MNDERPDSGLDVSRLVDGLREQSVPLETVDPADTLDGLAPLGSALADADVIGMGEASHGTREFFRFKHRLFRYLVEQQGLRLLGLESNFAATLAINDYVVDGVGTAEAALSQDSIHGSYQTDAVLELIEWVRSFNESRDCDTVRVHGFDVQDAAPAAATLRRYLEQADADGGEEPSEELEYLQRHGVPEFGDDEAMENHLDARETVVSTLEETFDIHEQSHVAATSREGYERARRCVWMLDQGWKQFKAIHDGRATTGANVRIRDSAMAAQVQWLRRHQGRDRIALWGHNAHLTRDAFGGGTVRHKQNIPSLGKNLATLAGVEYYSLGLVLGGGTVSAAYVPEGQYRAYDIDDPPDGSVPGVFRRVESPAFFLDVAGLDPETELARWLDSQPPHFDIVGGYESSPVNLVDSNYRSQFDGVVFVRDTSPSQHISTAD